MSASQALNTESSRYGIRETTEGLPRIIPELHLVGHVNYHTARPSFFNKHQHPDVLEIFLVVRGKVTWWVEGVSAEVAGKDLFLVWPRELHGARDNVVEPSEYYWIQVHLPRLRRKLGSAQALRLEKALRQARHRRLTGAPALPTLFQSLLQEHAHPSPVREEVVRQTLYLLLYLVQRSSETSNSDLPQRTPYHLQLARALQWARENISDADLAGMRAASGLDPSTFRQQFASWAGLGPAQYLIRLRLQHAKEQLARGKPVTEIAHHLGFSSSQYLATVFRKYEGLTPTEFLQKIRQGDS